MHWEGRKITETQSAQRFLIDRDGEIWPVTCPTTATGLFSLELKWDVIDYAVSKLGYIVIWPFQQSIFVSLQPDLVNPVTMTGAFYVIADLRPERIFISADTGKVWELFASARHAQRRIESVVAAARKGIV